ncbi:predicted protein [Naegleria gruberi]|uniref:Predicted protein n=1 Tax=Naegleria gruberi TaxID=5762 RepID=D2V0Y2_NAEGR|nr:uncharacterized protein NAEGRDRAFT_62456 [Naegleria gruberi]EFC49596.1 predicted protein [Naegleria gruberi]|eukprot:XP_002682340.1 predicted protein [Naegleria gruberi strain NEG-M]
MLEEELRKEEERMKNKSQKPKISSNNSDKLLRPPSASTSLNPPPANISPTASVELSNFLISSKNINNFISDAPPVNIPTEENNNSEISSPTSETIKTSSSTVKEEKNSKPSTPASDIKVGTVPKKQNPINKPSPQNELNKSIPIPENNLNGDSASSSQDSTTLFETLLKEELERSKQQSEGGEDKPAWAKKVDELDELITKFKTKDTNDSIFQDSETELTQTLNNRHPNILEKGVETLFHYVNRYQNVQNSAEKFINLLVDKGLSSKSSVQQKSTDIILLYFETCDPAAILTVLKAFFSSKKAKVRSQCIGIVKSAVQCFGFPTIPPKMILQSLPTILEDASSREESHKLAIETFKWLGYETVEPHLKDVKGSKLKALKDEYDLLQDKSPKPTRFSRLASVYNSTASIKNLVTAASEELKAKREIIDLNDKIRKDWYDDVTNAKWIIKRDALKELKQLLETFNIKKADYSEILSQINVIIQREKNVVVVKESIECLSAFSKALKTDFTSSAKPFYERLLTKLKEKNLSDSTIECLVSFDVSSFPFTDMLETIFSAMNNKTASTSEKLQIFTFIDKCFQNKKKKDLEKALKNLVNNLLSFCEDASSEVRDLCCKTLARLLFIIGDTDYTNLFLKLDSYMKEKIVQYLESYGSPPSDGVGKKLSQSIEKKTAPANIPKTTSSVTLRPSSRADTNPVRSSTSSLAKKPSSKPLVSKSISLKKTESIQSLSSSDVIEEANNLFGGNIVEQLANSNWNDRMLSLNHIESVISSLDKNDLQTKHEHIISLFQYKPGTKESNAKVLEKIFEIIERVLSSTEGKLSEVNIPPTLQWMIEKLATPKVDIIIQKAMKKVCESINPQFVFNKISETLTDKMPPKLIGSVLEWLGEVITEFSIACFNSSELIEFSKKYLGNSNPIIKKGCIKMLCSMKLFMGEGLLNFLGDVKPALLDMVKKDFSKVDSKPPEPTRKVKGEQLKVSSAMYDTLPRCDILPKLHPKIYHSMEDKNWMTRLEAIQTVEKIIVNDAHKRILPNILELIHALRQRLEDNNNKVVISTLLLIDLISEAVGPEMEKFIKILLPSVISKSMHNNKAVRTCALESLEKYLNIVQFESMLKIFPKSIASDKGNPEGKKEIIEFMHKHIVEMKNKNVDLFTPLVKPILDYLTKAGSDTRKLAEAILGEIISNGGYDFVFKRIRELKAAHQKGFSLLLQKYAPSTEVESQPPPVTQSLTLPTTPSNSIRGDKKITLRDVSKSLSVDTRQTEEEEGSKVPKTVKKRANISKTLATSPNKSPSPSSPKTKPITNTFVPKLQFSTGITGIATVDEYKLDLDKIEVNHDSPVEAETPMHDVYNSANGPMPGNITPRMPERSPVRDNKKEELISGHSIGELVKAINTNDHGSEIAINALKTLVSMFKDESCRPAILSYLKELVESLTDNTQYSFEKASAGLVSTRICKYLLSTLMQLFSNRQMAAFVPQETLQRMIDQLLSRLLDERLPSLDYGQELLRGLNSLMLKVLENSNRTYSYTSLIHLLEYSYANTSLKKYTELVVKCLIKLTKALAATIDRVDVDILLMDLHSFLTHNPPTFFKDRNDLPLRTIKTILNELVKVKGETIRSCLGLIPTHKNPLIISYIELMVNSAQTTVSSSTNSQATVPSTTTPNITAQTISKPPRNSVTASQIQQAYPLQQPSTVSNEKIVQDELTDIFNLISNKDSTHTGLYRLYEFKKNHPSVGINNHLLKCSEPFQQYIHRQLAKIAQYESSKQESFAASSHRAQSPASRQRQATAITSVDDIRRQLKLHQQESKQKNMGRSLTVSDLKKRIQNIEEKLSSTDNETTEE